MNKRKEKDPIISNSNKKKSKNGKCSILLPLNIQDSVGHYLNVSKCIAWTILMPLYRTSTFL